MIRKGYRELNNRRGRAPARPAHINMHSVVLRDARGRVPYEGLSI